MARHGTSSHGARARPSTARRSGGITATPRIELQPPAPLTAGRVTDLTGELLMTALPAARRLKDTVWYADDAIVLAGEGPRSISDEHRAAFQRRLLEIHRFLDAELGRGRHVRALVICDRGANDYRNSLGSFVALEDTWFDCTPDYSLFLAEQVIVREMASMWWAHGVRIAGAKGASMAQGFGIYMILRWFEVTGKQEELAVQLARWQERIQTIERAGESTKPDILCSARVGLALYASNGPALREELHRWCTEHWGCTVTVEWLAEQLARVGVRLPT
jgi:hypothetical protein